MGLVAPWHVGSSWTKEQTSAPTLASGFLTTRPPEGSQGVFLKALFLSAHLPPRRFLQRLPWPCV